jgi:hypothetical protein
MQVLFDITNLFLERVLSGHLLPPDFPTYETIDELSNQLPNDLGERAGDIVTENVK